MQNGGQKNRQTYIHIFTWQLYRRSDKWTDTQTNFRQTGEQTCRHLCLNTCEHTIGLRDEYTGRRTPSQLSHPHMHFCLNTCGRTNRRIHRQTDNQKQFFAPKQALTYTCSRIQMHTRFRCARLTSVEDVEFYQPCVSYVKVLLLSPCFTLKSRLQHLQDVRHRNNSIRETNNF